MSENIKTSGNFGSLLQKLTPRIFNDQINLLVGLCNIFPNVAEKNMNITMQRESNQNSPINSGETKKSPLNLKKV